MELKAIKDLALAFLYLPVTENKQIPLLVDHPYLDSAVTCVGDNMKNILEDEGALEVALQRYETTIKDAKDLETILMLLRRPYHLTFFKYIQDSLTRKEFSCLLADIWVNSENPNQDANVSLAEAVRFFKKARKEDMMTPDELAYYDNLPEEFTVYRGVAKGRAHDGLSWTRNYDKAKWFSERWGQGGYIRKGIVHKSDVLAYFNRRGEDELVISDKAISNQEIINNNPTE